MVLEIARIEVLPGKAEDFKKAVARSQPIFSAAKGCRSARLLRTDAENAFLLLVEWESLADHTVTFWASEGFKAWRDLVGGFFAGAPRVEHGAPCLVIRGEGAD